MVCEVVNYNLHIVDAVVAVDIVVVHIQQYQFVHVTYLVVVATFDQQMLTMDQLHPLMKKWGSFDVVVVDVIVDNAVVVVVVSIIVVDIVIALIVVVVAIECFLIVIKFDYSCVVANSDWVLVVMRVQNFSVFDHLYWCYYSLTMMHWVDVIHCDATGRMMPTQVADFSIVVAVVNVMLMVDCHKTMIALSMKLMVVSVDQIMYQYALVDYVIIVAQIVANANDVVHFLILSMSMNDLIDLLQMNFDCEFEIVIAVEAVRIDATVLVQMVMMLMNLS